MRSDIPRELRVGLRVGLLTLALLGLAVGCSDSPQESSEAEAASFCDVATGYLELQQEFTALNQSEDGGSAAAEREFWSTARTQAAELEAVAPPQIRADATTLSSVISEYDDALAAIDYEIDRLVTDDDPSLIERFEKIDLQASADAGREIESYYGVACGDLPGLDDLPLEPVPLDDLEGGTPPSPE